MHNENRVRHESPKTLAALYDESPEVPFDLELAEEISHEIPSCPVRREMLGNPPTLREHLVSLRTLFAKKEFLINYNRRLKEKISSQSRQEVGA